MGTAFRSDDLFSRLLPRQVYSIGTRQRCSPTVLCREEQDIVADAVDRRRSEFATGRACAHHLLERLGRPHEPLLRGARGAPVWPPGTVGSITHTDRFVAAAVSSDPGIASIGIDVESNEPLPEGVARIVCTDNELRALVALATAEPTIAWDRLVFSAKESVYKAGFPVTSEWLGFQDVELVVDPGTGSFRATLSPERASSWRLGRLTGRFNVVDGLIVTALCVTRPSTPGQHPPDSWEP